VQREEIRTPLSSISLARGPGLEPGTTLGTFDLIEAHSPYLGWLNDSPAFRAESVHWRQHLFEIDFLLLGHTQRGVTETLFNHAPWCLGDDGGGVSSRRGMPYRR